MNLIVDEDNYLGMLQYLICSDIKQLLGEFKRSKYGIRSTLLKRAKELLNSDDNEVKLKIKELYEARYKARNGTVTADKNDSNTTTSEELVSSDEPNFNLNSEKNDENHLTDNSEPMEVETNLNNVQIESSSSNIQNRSENLEKNNESVSQLEKNPTISAITANLALQILRMRHPNAIKNYQQSINNPLTFNLEQASSNLPISDLLRPPLTNFINSNVQLQIEQNITTISKNFQSMCQLFNEKFKEMDNYKCHSEIQEATMLISRPKFSLKTLICLNKLKTMDVDFTKYYHVNRKMLIDFFLKKKYEIHIRIACDPLKMTIPKQIKVFINRERYKISKINNITSINLTDYFLRRFKTFNPLYLEFNDTNNIKNYFCGIYLFRKQTMAELKADQCFGLINNLNKIDYVKNNKILPKENTICMLKEKLNSNQSEFEIVTDFLKIAMICPLTKTRIKIPARGKQCQHIQCFDLESYIILNEKSSKWSCPQCNKLTLFSDLVIDSFIQEIVKETNCDQIKLDSNGLWTEINSDSNLEKSLNDTIVISEKDDSFIILE